jgi:hypothetical protein
VHERTVVVGCVDVTKCVKVFELAQAVERDSSLRVNRCSGPTPDAHQLAPPLHRLFRAVAEVEANTMKSVVVYNGKVERARLEF